MLGYLAIDMYLPAFGMMQDSLNSTASAISASLSIFLVGFAIGQLLWGPLSDKIGRKPVLLMGLSLFALSCLAMVWVSTPHNYYYCVLCRPSVSALPLSPGRRWLSTVMMITAHSVFSPQLCRL